ncbi:signal peptide peptidase SppA [Desulfovibrio sp. JY]|nr:signal peptide peptidase SppA [Desulfovibrio sp. JY]
MTVLTEQLWAMEPKRLSALFRDMQAKGFPDAAARAAMLAATSSRDDPLYERSGPLAVIPLAGPLAKEGSWWWGITSTRDVGQALLQAATDPSVRGILLDIDSPGGTVDGIEELAGIVQMVAAQKPVYAYAADLMCSAAYWIGSQAQEIGTQATAMVGSIGVIMTHQDWSAWDAKMGVDITYLTAGKYKAMGNADEPLSDEARAYLQEGLDEVYGLFLDAVAQGRGVDRETALAMADGKVFLGRQALELGLVDRLESRADFINRCITEVHMDLAKLKAEHPGVAAELRAEVEQEMSAQQATALQAAVNGERDRCVGVVSALVGEEQGSKIAGLLATGVTPEQAKAMAGFMPKADNQGSSHAMLDAIAGVTQGPMNPAADATAAAPDFDALVEAEVKGGLSRGKAVAKVIKEHPEAHAAWLSKRSKEGK